VSWVSANSWLAPSHPCRRVDLAAYMYVVRKGKRRISPRQCQRLLRITGEGSGFDLLLIHHSKTVYTRKCSATRRMAILVCTRMGNTQGCPVGRQTHSRGHFIGVTALTPGARPLNSQNRRHLFSTRFRGDPTNTRRSAALQVVRLLVEITSSEKIIIKQLGKLHLIED